MIFALSINVALSGMVYPQGVMAVSAPYLAATVTKTIEIPGNLMVGMESNDNLETILEFYKTNLVANGWTISAETKQQGHSGLIGE